MATKAKVKAKKGAAKAKGGTDKMAKARAARGTVSSKYSGMSTEALLKAKANTPSEDKAAHYAIRRALRAGGYKISENRVAKAGKPKGKGAAKAAVKAATKGGKKSAPSKAKASKAKKSSTKGGDDWEDED